MYTLKTILAATDFSESAEKALDFAAGLAEHSSARLVLLHAFHTPVVASEVPTLMFTLGELEKNGMEQLEASAARIRKNHPSVELGELLCLHGFAGETIKNQAKRHGADLLVLGLQGHGFISEKLIGSNSFELVQESDIPVLIVNHFQHFRPIKRILLAVDQREITSIHVLEPLKVLAGMFKAEVIVLHVNRDESELPTQTMASSGVRLDHFLDGIPHRFAEVSSPNFMEALNKYADQNGVDLTVALARQHGFFESLFRKNHVQEMIYHTHTPILTIHE